ncbi:MAG TPA: YqgE/AlgH family protein [Bryobacteraceae bacterium]|nr:YqgE/AlgH family protein [Bryobacteraceae bacterium]
MLKGVTVAILTGAPLLSAWAQDDLGQGKILVADRKLKDPSFEHSVVYLISYDEMGAVGVILNRETDTPVGKILSGVKGASNRKDFAFSGGPVETNSVLALHRTTARRRGAQQASSEVAAILDEAALKEVLASGGDSGELRFYLGYAGWGPGQLEAEVEAGAWFITGGGARIVFDSDPDTLWDRLIRRKDAVVARVARPLSPSLPDLLTFKGRPAHGTQLHPAHATARNVPAVCGFQLPLRASLAVLPAQSPRPFLLCSRRQGDRVSG